MRIPLIPLRVGAARAALYNILSNSASVLPHTVYVREDSCRETESVGRLCMKERRGAGQTTSEARALRRTRLS